MTLGRSSGLQLTAAEWKGAERRKIRRSRDRSRHQARIGEFAAAAFIGGWVALGLAFLVQDSLARPFRIVEQALAGPQASAPASAR
jgi:hypothetical protein